MAADAKKALLQIAIAREFARVHHAVDATVDHDRDFVGNGSGDADILLDDEYGKFFFAGEADKQIAHLRDDQRRQTLRRLVHHKQARIAEKRARDRQHLLLAARQLRAAIALAFGEARERRIDPLDAPRIAASADAEAEAQCFVDGQARP